MENFCEAIDYMIAMLFYNYPEFSKKLKNTKSFCYFAFHFHTGHWTNENNKNFKYPCTIRTRRETKYCPRPFQ